ncbi:MAG: ADYC domain-containing protein [Kofleriaceae bacterium]|nr:ADYC domain-containing protein [Kofleriaceae bacterium]
MGKAIPSWTVALVMLCGCGVDDEAAEAVSTVEQHGINMQGINMQGINMQGINMQGFALGNATLAGASLANLRVVKGELVAERNGVTVRGTGLTGAELVADVTDVDGGYVQLAYRIASVQAEVGNDPTGTGNTFLYNVEQWVDDTASWQPACGVDADGRRAAIPVGATWNQTGDRVESSTHFTFACTTGVIAKCYRWGYRPWLTGYGGADFTDYHQACTRMARADYCGNGTPHTRENTAINVWDRLPAPGPIQKHGLLPPVGMLFEAGWSPHGAVCLSRARWLLDSVLSLELANACPDRLVPPSILGGTVCDTLAEVLLQHADALVYNEAYLLNL